LSALFAAAQVPELAMSYVNSGGFGNSQWIIYGTRLSDVYSLNDILYPVRRIVGSQTYRKISEL